MRIGYYCHYLQELCFHQECGRLRTEGVGFSACLDPALAERARADDGYTPDNDAAEAATAAGFHDEERGRKVLKSSTKDASLGAVLSHWLVHGKPPKRHHRVKVVDGES